MKRTKKTQWYVVCDGKGAIITNNIETLVDLNVVIIEITADQAASILMLEKSSQD